MRRGSLDWCRGNVVAQFGLITVAVVWADVLASPTRVRVAGVTAVVVLLNAFDPVILPDWEQHRVLQLQLCAMPQYGLVGLGSGWLGCVADAVFRE